MDQNEMTISAYDVEIMRNEQRRIDQRHERSIRRWKSGATAVGFLAAAGAVVGVALVFWMGVRGPSAKDQLEDQQKRECIAQHGTWVKISQGTDGDYGSCIFGTVNP